MAEHLASIFGTEDRMNCPFYFKIGADFYEDLFEELSEYGDIENLNICDNIAGHMVDNVYVQFREEEHAANAVQNLTGRFYAGKWEWDSNNCCLGHEAFLSAVIFSC